MAINQPNRGSEGGKNKNEITRIEVILPTRRKQNTWAFQRYPKPYMGRRLFGWIDYPKRVNSS